MFDVRWRAPYAPAVIKGCGGGVIWLIYLKFFQDGACIVMIIVWYFSKSAVDYAWEAQYVDEVKWNKFKLTHCDKYPM